MISRFAFRESGQSMLMVVFIGFLLFATIPTMIYINDLNSKQQNDAPKKSKAFATARAGVAYAKNILGTNWPASLTVSPISSIAGGSFSDFMTTETTPHPIPAPDGSTFEIFADRPLGILPYQVRVVATALDPGGTSRPIRRVEAYVSPATLAVSLPEDVHASVALELVHSPVILGDNLVVHWGPISCLDTNAPADSLDLHLATSMNPPTHPYWPRRFAAIAIHPNQPLSVSTPQTVNTDEESYWAFASLGFMPPLLDILDSTDINYALGYSGVASNQTCTFANVFNYVQNPPLSCRIEPAVAHTAIVFGTVSTPATINFTTPIVAPPSPGPFSPPHVLYIAGDAQFVNMPSPTYTSTQFGPVANLPTTGGLVVTGNLDLFAPAGGAAGLAATHIPPTAPLEYGNGPGVTSHWWPGYHSVTAPTITANVQMQGFLWVKGSLTVNSGAWIIFGVVLVGDPSNPSPATPPILTIPSIGGSLTIYYDDNVNRNVITGGVLPGASVQLQTDSMREVPAN